MSAAGPDLTAAQLQAAEAAERLRSEGRPLVGYVVGDPGSGKTTLMEFARVRRALKHPHARPIMRYNPF